EIEQTRGSRVEVRRENGDLVTQPIQLAEIHGEAPLRIDSIPGFSTALAGAPAADPGGHPRFSRRPKKAAPIAVMRRSRPESISVWSLAANAAPGRCQVGTFGYTPSTSSSLHIKKVTATFAEGRHPRRTRGKTSSASRWICSRARLCGMPGHCTLMMR